MFEFKLDKKSKRILREAPKILETGARKGFEPAAKVVEKEARRRVPVRTGYLQSTIEYEITKDMFSVFADTPYAYKVEQRRPFLNPAAEAKLGTVEEIINKSIQDEWERR